MPGDGWKPLITEGNLEGSSKWYPDDGGDLLRNRPRHDSRAARPRSAAPDTWRIASWALRDDNGGFGNILQTAQAASALYYLGCLDGMRRETPGGEVHRVRSARTAAGRNSSRSAIKR